MREQLERLCIERRHKLEKLRAERRRASRSFEAAANELNQKAGGSVRVLVEPLGDKSALKMLLSSALSGQSVRSDQLAKLAHVGPAALSSALASNAVNEVAKLGVSVSTAQKLLDLGDRLKREIEEIETPDLVSVEVDLGSSDNSAWTSLVDVSPGQRATAMLSLALATGDEPLIIDQPEDDLDNRYIYQQVVSLLAEVSKRRQVIVATHNANIPILGDAELVVALGASAHKAHVLVCGGLDDKEVAETARMILEGGDEAFRARARRYNRVD